MRRLLRFDLPISVILPLFLLIIIQGCAGPILQTYPVDQKETDLVTEAFLSFLQLSGEICNCCLDAEADTSISVSGWFSDHTGKFSGYLQAMEPGYIKFVALNPLGQPWYMLVTDGKTFKSLNIFEEKAYTGSVRSEIFDKFVPAGFEPEDSYYWLTGRLPPVDMQIKAVRRDREKDAFWLQINHAEGVSESMVLFDPEEMLVLRHVLQDELGRLLADVVYADYQVQSDPKGKNSGNVAAYNPVSAAEDFCRVPGRIFISSREGSKKIEVKLHSLIDDARFSAEDFSLNIPDNFQQLFVR